MPVPSPSADLELPTGLDSEEAARRLNAEGANELPVGETRTLLDLAIELIREPMLLLLVATGVVYFLLGDLGEALAILGAIAIVIGLTLYQEQKTERTLSALRDLSSPLALVIRAGVSQRIPSREVVRGDLLVLSEGDRIPADGVLVSSTNLTVDESLLTGESVPVRKTLTSGDRSASLVFSGTLVVSGHGRACVSAIGRATELGQIGRALSDLGIERTSLQSEVSRVVGVLATAGLAACALVAVVYGLRQQRWLDGVLAGLTMAIAMVPEEFPVVLTIFLALGAWRISRSHVLTRRIPAIETLGSATVLCVDKTGTLTLNRMAVAVVAVEGETREITSVVPLDPPFRRVLDFAFLASRKEPFDPMERAFADLGQRLQIASEYACWALIREYPLSDELPAFAQAWRPTAGGRALVAVKGAPEAVADLCRLNASAREAVLARVDAMAGDGLRVLAVARSDVAQGPLPESMRAFPWTFLGLIGLADPVRPGVNTAIQECRAAGIRVVMITGDYPATALNIARQIGFERSEECLSGAELARLDDEEFRRRAQQVDVFARMIPQQKLRLVNALRDSGAIVAMTGDGVNDAPALKAAHIGIAMGARGTDVAREAAALILMDDDFTSIVRAVRLGRRIYDNIRKAMAYVLAIHLPIAGLSLVPVLFGGPLILLPLHLIFMELIVDPACSVAFETEPDEPDLMRRPPRNPAQRLFDVSLVVRSLLQGLGVCGIAMLTFGAAWRSGYGETDVRMLTFATLILGNLALIFTNRSSLPIYAKDQPWNPALLGVAGVALVGLAATLYIAPVRDMFRLAPPHPADLAVLAVVGLLMVSWVELVKAIDRRVSHRAVPR